MKRLALTVTFTLVAAPGLVTTLAYAQPIGTPSESAPTTLDPGSSGNQGNQPGAAAAAAAAAASAAQQRQAPPKPTVLVIGPDGKVVPDDAPPGADATTYYVPDGSSPGSGDPSAGDADRAQYVHSGPTPELHVVRSGDTLWDICWAYFNDPWQWPKVWSYNPQITNPHWIYPGDLVRLIPRGVFVTTSTIHDPEGATAGTVDPVPAPAVRSELGVKTLAFVEQSDLDKAIVLDGAVDEKMLLGDGDQVYLSYPKDHPPKVGQRYSVYTPGQSVKHGTKKYGSYVKLLGTIEVLSVKDDKRARGVIIESTMEMERGAKVGPLVTRFANVPPTAPTVDAQAPIVAQLTKDQLIGEGEVIFVALGKSSGVKVGNRMYVVRRGDAYPNRMSTVVGSDDRRFPARALGEVVIVEVGENVSIGLVTLSVQEMAVGDLVMMQKRP